ncbi:DUF3732 domain-containing protein [Methylobacterium sp. Leaf102]|uniref:DUF3732 domain-containing protein n=1 Tax=Methylobacterium sp. Leaf102 TaxID=1736253 RepID=UPI000A442064|nr:DUF3732 domain-containing protein [Methylobacterium sp. Leaf102]
MGEFLLCWFWRTRWRNWPLSAHFGHTSSQVYLPSEASYKSVGGTVDEIEQGDVDLETVRRLFALLSLFATEDAPGFQLIVSEHAKLRDKWFQAALVEDLWTKPPALVPDNCADIPKNQITNWN